MAKTNALVMVSAIFAIMMIVMVGFATGHNSNLATGGISALSLVLGGAAIYTREKSRRQ